MKTILILCIILAASCSNQNAAEATIVYAKLPNNTQLVAPKTPEDISGLLQVNARFVSSEEIQSFTQGNWRDITFLVRYSVIDKTPEYTHDEISFISRHNWPTKESGIVLRSLIFPWKDGKLTFYLEKDPNCKAYNFYKIVSYTNP